MDQEVLAKLSRHPRRPGRRARPVTRRRTLVGRGRRRGRRGGQPVFDISDSDKDVKPDVKMEDSGAGSSSGGRRRGGRGRYDGR
jgi:hypothetical protein